MNKTKIEYCDYTWNPVTGCLHNCWYCYAAKIANRFGKSNNSKSKIHELVYHDGTIIDLRTEINDPIDCGYLPVGLGNPYPFKFEPSMHYYRLDEPRDIKKGSKIFVCSMADLFGDWVPAEWIKEVLKTVKETPWHTFLFLTKNPKRYAEFEFPENCWLGVTVTGIEKNQSFLWGAVSGMDNIKFISYEPLLGMPEEIPKYLTQPDWVIIGGLTPKPIHEFVWVERILQRCGNIPVFCKSNLKWIDEIKEYPTSGRDGR